MAEEEVASDYTIILVFGFGRVVKKNLTELEAKVKMPNENSSNAEKQMTE